MKTRINSNNRIKNLLLLCVAIGLLSCHNEEKENVEVTKITDSIASLKQDLNIDSVSYRANLIIELNKLSDAIAKKDRDNFLEFFDFPLADSLVNFFEVDSIFDAERKLNDGAITKKMFQNSFNKIYEQTDMLEFNNLFRFLNTNDLERKDKINFENKVKGDGCYYFYSITIRANEVFITYGTNSNDDYRKTHPDDEEICDEYAQAWVFKFDGKNLRFVKHRIAG